MKKIAAALCLVFLISLPAFGGGFKFHFGPAFTNLKIENISYAPFEKKPLLQFAGGIGLELSFTSNIALEFDIMYNPGGAKWTYTIPAGDVVFTYKGYGVAVPVLLKFSFLSGTTPYIVAGGTLAYTTSQKMHEDYPGGTFDADFTDDVARFQYALTFGGGLEIVLGGMTFLIEGRYSLGLSNVLKEPFDDEKVSVQNIFILFGYKF